MNVLAILLEVGDNRDDPEFIRIPISKENQHNIKTFMNETPATKLTRVSGGRL